MPHHQYLIVGGGMAADAAVRGIREVDSGGSIGLIGEETAPPYKRPPLTKALWKGDPVESIWLGSEKLGVEVHLGRRVEALDLRGKAVVVGGETFSTFDKLLLATGGTPRRLAFGDGFIYYRWFTDYERLRALTERAQSFAVVGGGFIGSEIAAALAMNQREVTMFFPDETIGPRVFPKSLGRFVNGYYRDKGVKLLAGESVVGAEKKDGRTALQIKSGAESRFDGVIVGIGIQPNGDLAAKAGLAVENGVVVNELLQTDHPDVYAAGDVANFFNPALGSRLRVEHEDNALTMGRIAGRNMAGEKEPYRHLPFFYSDLFELGYEAVGDVDARLQTVEDWKEPNREGCVYYLRDGRVRGVLLWNVWNQVDAARDLIGQPGPFRPEDLKGRLPA
ncbi:MAG TPA: FAD/NAD(P)-binding oxidoreductase [Thermoanaerobaculia bacterium]|jgi:NADPH-dependent 2,4-dienoyl-CoA reductase/sulfur reductase-like enzyme